MQLVVDKLVQAVESYFSVDIERTNYKIKELLSQQDVVAHEELASVNCLHDLLEYHAWRLCHKTFVYEFHLYREKVAFPADPSSTKIFDQYVNLIDEQLLSDWFTKYDVLRKMVTQAVCNSCIFIEEVCTNFSKDAPSLLSSGLINSGAKLKAIKPLDSDPHNGSKVVLCLEFESSPKILYKPRSLEIDVLIDKLFSDALKFDTLQDYSPVPRTMNRGEYGWQEFIQHAPIRETEISNAYYNLGLCAAVFSCLGTTDLHDENIKFNGVFPYFIDLETSLQPTYNRTNNTLDGLMLGVVTDSIAATSIIPAKQLTIPHEILVGAINTPYPQKTIEMVFTWKNTGTDAIDLAKEQIKITRTTVPIMLADNQVPDPLPFQEDFLKGYSDGYEKMLEKREQIYSLLTDINGQIRVVLRPTTQYYFMLDACLFPENLIDDNTINQVLKYLKPPRLIRNPEIARDTLEEEIRSLKNGDIPHFSIGMNGNQLYSSDFISKEIFDLSPKNNAIELVNSLSPKRQLNGKRLIAEGFSDIRIHEAKYKKVDDIGYQSSFFSNVLRKVTKENPNPLIELISSLSITTESDQAETGWIGGVYGEIPISYESTPLISLHDTGGILFLLNHLTECKNIENYSEYMDLSNQAKRGLNSLRSAFSSQLESTPISVISGPSSLDFIFNFSSNRAMEIERVVSKVKSENTPRGDVFNGPVGIGLVLPSFSETPNQLLTNLETIICDTPSNMLVSDGLAHGNLGVIWAQFRLSYSLGDTEKCKALLEKALQISFPSTVNAAGWCCGNAGLLMVLAEMASTLNEQLDLYDLAKKSTELPQNSPIDLSICHGAAGVLQSLLFTYEASGDSWYLSLANQYWETVLELANIHGFYTGEKNRDYLLGYFLGWGGVADSALLLKMYNDGESAWFPLNLSSVSYQRNNMKTGGRERAFISGN